MKEAVFYRVYTILAAALLWLVLAGCASTQRVNWNSRVGNYTFEKAIVDLGEPTQYTPTKDGGVVADWLAYHGTQILSTGYGGTGYFGSPDTFIRLTFGPDDQLRAWQYVYRPKSG